MLRPRPPRGSAVTIETPYHNSGTACHLFLTHYNPIMMPADEIAVKNVLDCPAAFLTQLDFPRDRLALQAKRCLGALGTKRQ